MWAQLDWWPIAGQGRLQSVEQFCARPQGKRKLPESSLSLTDWHAPAWMLAEQQDLKLYESKVQWIGLWEMRLP